MARPASPFKLLAAAMTLVMATSVTLPVVAHACEAMNQRITQALCCRGEKEHSRPAELPCHGDQESIPAHEDDPAGESVTCCASGELVATDAAALAETPTPPQAQESPSVESMRVPTEDADRASHSLASERPPGARDGIGLPVLYGALLN